jgi:uncharacterized membrane protein YraQ (UPF0718 family)
VLGAFGVGVVVAVAVAVGVVVAVAVGVVVAVVVGMTPQQIENNIAALKHQAAWLEVSGRHKESLARRNERRRLENRLARMKG